MRIFSFLPSFLFPPFPSLLLSVSLNQSYIAFIFHSVPATTTMAISNPEASNLNTTSDDGNPQTTITDRLPFSRIKLQKLPHLTDYLPTLQTFTNPLDQNEFYHSSDEFYISPTDVVLRQIVIDISGTFSSPSPHLAYHRAGPRKQMYFDPSKVKAAIVTCGGLCPGLNTVVRELVVGLWELYGVRQIFGIIAGYGGFYSMEPMHLNPKLVHHWHKLGGTALQTSRGGFDLDKIVNAIQNRGFNQVFLSTYSVLTKST